MNGGNGVCGEDFGGIQINNGLIMVYTGLYIVVYAGLMVVYKFLV